jgi:hypothetical protein
VADVTRHAIHQLLFFLIEEYLPMTKKRPSGPFLAGVGLILVAMTMAPAQLPIQPQPQPANQPNGLTVKGTQITQQFPTTGPMQSAWKVRWRQEDGPGLIIVDAFFKKGPKEDWIQVLGESRLAEAFVPYHRGSPRFWDVQYDFPLCTVTEADAGRSGKLLSSKPGEAPTVVLEQRDDGIGYKDWSGVRRSEAVVLWGAMSAANYRYITEYTFRDDGLIRFRLGSTGHNYSGSEWEPHMHNSWWRIDVNLGGPDHNSVDLVEHIEPHPDGAKSKAATVRTPFNGGKEGFADFNAEKFTMLSVYNTKKKNIRNQPWTYDLVPHRMGNSRHYGGVNETTGVSKEACSLHDFWVTKNVPPQGPQKNHYHDLPTYVKDGANIQDTDIVIWYSTAGHHEPRSEDGEVRPLGFTGATPVMWNMFELRPRNFWDRTPLYPYKKLQVKPDV